MAFLLTHTTHTHNFNSPLLAAKTVSQMLSAVSFLHSRHIVHRDLKLENWVLESGKDVWSPLKLIDFGCGCFMNKKQGGERAHSKDSDENEIEVSYSEERCHEVTAVSNFKLYPVRNCFCRNPVLRCSGGFRGMLLVLR